MSPPTLYVIGGVNVDLILGTLDDWPRRGTEIMLAQSECRPGGPGANTGLALAARRVPSRVIANIGDDMFGRWLSDSLGGNAESWARSTRPTTMTVGIVHGDGERTFLTTEGHLAAFSPEDVAAQLPLHAAPGDIALLCCPFLSPLLMEQGEALLGELAERGFVVALDTAWPPSGWSETTRRLLLSWLPRCRHVLLNDLEAKGLTGEEDLDRATDLLLARLAPGATLVIKRGAGGASAWHGGERIDRPAPQVTVIDTIGAGDIFNAGYLEGQLRGLALADCLALGVEAASSAISTSPRRYTPAGA